ncbi:hypothetical protein [Celerinatantimonas yamalensis]|uniref:Fe-S cluster assembly iron-binding protein IscA n=1 Tax=Celerinatantimonas yamalensis TaxID=559956 RepID=A0ABW9G4H4_9GAMM
MIVVTEQARPYLQRLHQRFPEQGMRLFGAGNRCQGLQIQAKLQHCAQPDDRQEQVGDLPVWISASLATLAVSLEIDVETQSQVISLLFNAQWAPCSCEHAACYPPKLDVIENHQGA